MFIKRYTRWMAGTSLAFALVANLAGVGSASAASLDAAISVASTSAPAQISADGSTSIPAGTMLTISGSSYVADEPVGLWINVPDGVSISADSLGQDNTEVVDGVVGLDNMGSADDNGAFSYTLDTTGLPSGNYSLVAHGLRTGLE